MNEESKEPYDPRIEHDWVPAALAMIMTVVKCAAFIAPHVVAIWGEIATVESLNKVAGDETFNAVWISVVSFWVAKKVYQK